MLYSFFVIKNLQLLHLLRPKVFLSVFVLCSVIYIAQSLLYTTPQEVLDRYQISAGEALVIIMAITIPYLLIWFVAARGYTKLWDYNNKIAGHKDGDAFQYITLGILLLALWLPITAIFGNFASHYPRSHPGSVDDMVRLDNYLNIIILLPAYVFTYIGAKKLSGTTSRAARFVPKSAMLLYGLFSIGYTYLVLKDPARATAVQGVEAATYYLPDWLIFTTIVVPRLLMWFLGLAAVYKIYQYQKFVKGTLYKEALAKLAIGICWILIGTVVLRVFQTLSVQLNNLDIGMILLIIYFLLALLATGYVFVSQGTKRLGRLEEI